MAIQLRSACRLCLSKKNVKHPIFEDEHPNLADKILVCTKLQIPNIGFVPSSVCEECKTKVLSCFDFIQKCIETEKKVRRIYAKEFENYEGTIKDECLNEEIETVDYDCSDEKNLTQFSAVYVIEEGKEAHSGSKKGGETDSHTYSPSSSPGRTEIFQDKIDSSDSIHEENPNARKKRALKQKKSEIKLGKRTDEQGKVVKQRTRRECPVCGKWQRRLAQHMKLHTEEKKHICPYCNKSFASRSNYNCHLNIHTGNTPYKCKECERSFKDPTSLRKHKITHSTEPLFQCDICGRDFKHLFSYQSHIRSHNNDRRYACSSCDKSFVLSTTLRKHEMTHTGERPHQCPECPKAFICSWNLRMHMLKHTEKPFACGNCDAAFGNNNDLEQHMTEVHSAKSEIE